jgi:hypothetical protein
VVAGHGRCGVGGGGARQRFGDVAARVWAPIPLRVQNPDELRLDRIKTGLAVAAGLAAGVTLLMTLRRQALNERAQHFSESDALVHRDSVVFT